MEKMTEFSLLEYLKRQNDWDNVQFPKGEERKRNLLKKIKKELKEAKEKPDDPYEYIDIVILALASLHNLGYSPSEVIDFMLAKQRLNFSRKYVQLTDGTWQHV